MNLLPAISIFDSYYITISAGIFTRGNYHHYCYLTLLENRQKNFLFALVVITNIAIFIIMAKTKCSYNTVTNMLGWQNHALMKELKDFKAIICFAINIYITGWQINFYHSCILIADLPECSRRG